MIHFAMISTKGGEGGGEEGGGKGEGGGGEIVVIEGREKEVVVKGDYWRRNRR